MSQCITRKRNKWFSPTGKKLTGGHEKRARKLAIPPAYTEVCISPKPNAKLQGTALDAKGKKHYYYHTDFTKEQTKKRLKRVKTIDRGAILRHTGTIIRKNKMDKQWSAAVALRLVLLTGIRTSQKSAESVGLLNLRPSHVRVSRGQLRLVFVGKSKQKQNLLIKDALLKKALVMLKRRQGRNPIFDVSRSDIVSILSHHGENLKLKDLRTRLAIETFHAKRKAIQKSNPSWDMKKVDKEALKHAASLLGHTPSVCKKYYVLEK